ncbi:hypothetical protein PCC7424_5607 (plasmid) [Gloeothece citriformis PCC 7424]|uniref:Uncharacterized protein n=1 Tax=Gloeothece citriformis (strain PCC 7424) TaxID=65393 RepID=B7KMZ4_GLOC7|nr:hypothetical protein [Gloeothece citriformis]ACK74166.1 hypothetical protein PCC7424_5607 [Gloeothece citriformis PCC 7424]
MTDKLPDCRDYHHCTIENLGRTPKKLTVYDEKTKDLLSIFT